MGLNMLLSKRATTSRYLLKQWPVILLFIVLRYGIHDGDVVLRILTHTNDSSMNSESLCHNEPLVDRKNHWLLVWCAVLLCPNHH